VQVCCESAAGTLLLTPGFFAFGVVGAPQAGQQQGMALGPAANHARHALKPVFGGVVWAQPLLSSAAAGVGFPSGIQQRGFCAAGAKLWGWGCCAVALVGVA